MKSLFISKKVFGIICLMLPLFVLAQEYPFQNPNLSSEERAKDLISRLTIEEKAKLLCDNSEPIPRLGIKRFNWWSEALHGYANNDSVTVFPEPIGMAASFNEDLVFQIFDATSDEARAKYHQAQNRGEENRRFLSLSVWTPNVNIFRDPRWGRGQETYGEDPYLTTKMGVQVVKGLQGPEDEKYKKLLACAKHYAVHSGPEWSRHELNLNDVNPRELYETYLPAFKSLVQESDVRQVMCAYQRLDDEPCCSSDKLLQKILRDEWGFEHIVVTDCGAITDFYTTHNVSSTPVHAAARGLLGGSDLECIWDNYTYMLLPEALERDLIKEEDIDKSLMRVLIGRFDLGEMDDDSLVKWAQIPASILNNDKHKELAYEMAKQSMTLLLNKNNTLPINKNSNEKIAVIGPNADNAEMLWGNYNGTPISTITILDGFKTKMDQNKIIYEKAVDHVDDKVTISYFNKCAVDGNVGFKATYWNHPDFEGEPVAIQQLSNPIRLTAAGQHEFAPRVWLENFSAKYETVFVPDKTEELVFKTGATGFYELKVNGEIITTYTNWRTLLSKYPYKFEKGKEYKIEIKYAHRENWEANIEFDFGKEEDVNYVELIKTLKDVQTVVFVGGLSGNYEGEEMPVSFPGFKGGDRTNIDLPSVQLNCLKALKEAGKEVIYINCSGSAIAFEPIVDYVDAILQAWYPGEQGGLAVADVIFGDYNPSGKLPVTFYKNSSDLGDIEDYSMKGKTYRYFSDAMFPFGYGLSYTDFKIGKAKINNKNINLNENVEINIPVQNSGKRDGVEVVQIYIKKVDDVDGPLKTLRAYKKVSLKAGEKKNVKLTLADDSFEFYDWDQRKVTTTAGEYEILYGNSSIDEDLKSIIITIK